jgi:L-asparaginase II
MIATCVAAGWPVEGYRDPAHPLQEAVRAVVTELTGVEPVHVTVDGCGAPLFSSTPSGVARAFARLVTAAPGTPEHRVTAAVAAHPEWVGGSTGRIATELMRGVPGLVAKEGAEGVCAAALPGGAAAVVKVLDGAMRPVPAVVADVLRRLGADVPDGLGATPVEGGGAPVGAVTPALA